MTRASVLLVANYDSGVGYAWWLMESFWVAMAEHYAAQGRSVLLAYPSISKLPEAISVAPLKVEVTNFAATNWSNVWRQLIYLRRHRVALVYLSDATPLHWRYALFRFAGVGRIVIHDHSPGARPRAVGWKHLLKRAIYTPRLLTADAYFGASEYIRRRLVESTCIPRKRCFAIPNGLPPAEYVEAVDLSARFGIPAGRVVIVMTARATRYKGIGFAIECIAQVVHQERVDLHLLLCGDGPHIGEFQQLAASLGVQTRVTFAGKQNGIPGILKSCHIAFHPSQGEVGYSLSILEYMRAGLPVIVPDNPSVCGATRDRIDGLVYPEGNSGAACAAIVQLATNVDMRTKLGTAGAQSVEDRYRLTDTHGALLNALASVYP
ncbi:MAG TPA: glycosyltransferase family 4 protein [Steroidobacteraceae bacterium]|nr:glycosyltransferase family 4 protein [Steroidobacteraceae bacterium]